MKWKMTVLKLSEMVTIFKKEDAMPEGMVMAHPERVINKEEDNITTLN